MNTNLILHFHILHLDIINLTAKYQYRTGQRTEYVSSFRYRNLTPIFENVTKKSIYYGKQYVPWVVGVWLVLKGSETLDNMYLDHHRSEWP